MPWEAWYIVLYAIVNGLVTVTKIGTRVPITGPSAFLTVITHTLMAYCALSLV